MVRNYGILTLHLLFVSQQKVTIIMKVTESDNALHKKRLMALRDALDVLSGKWKFCILQSLSHFGTMRFKDLQETVGGISPKVLSKELQELEQNLLITRTVNNTKPVTVSYALKQYAKEIEPVTDALIEFGLKHSKQIKGK